MLTDEKGQSVAQSSISVPSFLGTIPMTVRAMLKHFGPDSWSPGDVAITNDPWLGTGHLPDVTLVTPVFRLGKMVGFVGNTAHMVDIGGTVFGESAHDVYGEGLYIPPLKLYDGGRIDKTLEHIMSTNVRSPQQFMGDIHAQVACNEAAAASLCNLLGEYDLQDLTEVAHSVHARSERVMRDALRRAPEGTYQHQLELDGFDEPIRICISVTIKDGHITADYEGSSPQQRSPINAVPNYSYAYTAFAIKAAFDAEVPNNEGFLRAITVTAPPGCIMHAVRPAPVQSRHVIGQIMQSAVYGALSQAVPERVMADSGTPPVILSSL